MFPLNDRYLFAAQIRFFVFQLNFQWLWSSKLIPMRWDSFQRFPQLYTTVPMTFLSSRIFRNSTRACPWHFKKTRMVVESSVSQETVVSYPFSTSQKVQVCNTSVSTVPSAAKQNKFTSACKASKNHSIPINVKPVNSLLELPSVLCHHPCHLPSMPAPAEVYYPHSKGRIPATFPLCQHSIAGYQKNEK